MDVAGNVFVQGAESPTEAAQSALNDCNKNSTGCRIDDVIRNSQVEGNYFPVGPVERRLFASVARPKGTPPPKWDDSAWLASGQRGFKAAEQAALSQCRQDTGMACEIRVDAASQVARIADGTGHMYWIDLAAPQTLDKQLRNYDFCDPGKGHACRLVDTFEVRTPPRTMVIEVSQSDHPARGFYSLARPIDDAADRAWRRRALVTGASSRKAAQAAAVRLCEARSHARCEATPPEGDRGVDQFLILLRDNAGKVLGGYGMSAADARSNANQVCAKHAPPCEQSVPVDLAEPVSTVLVI